MEEEPNEDSTSKVDKDHDPDQEPAMVLSLTSSSDSLTEEDLFEPVSLREVNNADDLNSQSDPDRANSSMKPPRSFSPLKSRRKLSMSDTPPEILHLVDSAIMGSAESIEMLRGFVAEAGDEGSREVVDALISTMGGAEGLDDVLVDPVPKIMKNTMAAVIAVDLITWLPGEGDSGTHMSPRTRMVKGLLTILRSCARNRAMCTASGLLRMLLDAAEKMFAESSGVQLGRHWDFTPLCQCIQVLAGHSLSVIDLHHWLGVINGSLMTDWALPLVVTLEKAVGSKEARGPANTFEFDGERSGLVFPGETRWPFPSGYAFATWIYMESFQDAITMAEDGVKMPRLFSYLFSFLSSDNYGVEAYFHGQFLVVETGVGKGKKASIHFSYLFQPRCWYFVGIEHVCKQVLLGKEESELKLYVDGNLHETRPFEFPKISKPLACHCIGTNPPPKMAGLQRRRKQCPLFAEMGPVYIFKEPIGQERMTRLASRGGDTLPSFVNGAGLPWLAVNEHVRTLAEESAKLDAEIGESLHLLYHPNLLSGRSCPDASPSGVAGLHRLPSEVIGQVHAAFRFRPAESLWALAYGGPMVLLPLTVSKVQMDSLEPVLGDLHLSLATASLSAPIFRMISMVIQHPGNVEELCRTQAPELLARILHYLLPTISKLQLNKQSGLGDEELVAAIVSLCQSQKNNHTLKVQFFSTLLLDLKIWSMCNYGLQKKLLSSLADMVFTESSAMRDANALQILLDGCRRCYWVVCETDSVDTFSLQGAERPVGEVNALVDELLVVIELLVGEASSSSVNDDVRCLISFLADCPQPNQVARLLHLIYRFVVQPNTSRAHTFAQSFLSCGGIESLLFLLQQEAKTGNHNILDGSSLGGVNNVPKRNSELGATVGEKVQSNKLESFVQKESISDEMSSHPKSLHNDDSSLTISLCTDLERMASSSETQLLKTLGGISFSISADSARNNVFNIDNGDGVVIGIINLLGVLVISGHLTFATNSASHRPPSNIWSSVLLHEEGSSMFDDKVSLLLFSLQKAFQAAPQRLLTTNVYMALLGAAINVSSTDDGLNLYDSGHRFEHVQLLLVLLRSLPYASTSFQARAIQDLLFLACSHPENRTSLTCMAEWPEWILEVLMSNYEMGSSKDLNGISIGEIEDLIHNFLIIVLEHSMRQKDGWKDVEATIHCAEWLSMIGGSSTGDQRVRREEALPIFKRRLLGGLLDFAARELQVQTEVIAAAAAGVAAEGLSPHASNTEAENAAHLSVALAENAVVVLMLVEDHLRLQAQLSHSSKSASGLESPATATSTNISRSNSLSRTGSGSFDTFGSKRSSISSDTGGLSVDVLASMADSNGQVSAAVMERLTAAAAAEPYESVRCAFVAYGSCTLDLAEGWKYRSKLWYGVGLPPKATFGGGGSGWELWKSVLDKDANGNWIELPLVKKSVTMLQALLLDECAIGGGLNVGCGSGTGIGGMRALHHLLDSDQPFLCMLRVILASMREDDNGEDDIFMRNISIKDGISEGLSYQASNLTQSENSNRLLMRKPRSALLWSVLGPLLNMPVSESKRQRVLVASCIMYSEVWHAIGREGTPLRKKYVETILPPFVAILRRWKPLLAGIHELTSSDYENPLTADDPALASDSLPLEAALSMVSPGWASAFASPPSAMALAMIAAGTAGGETVPPPRTSQLRRDTSLLERKTTRLQLHTFSSFQKPLETPNKTTPMPKDKAAAKAAALVAARDLERNAKIGTGRGLSAVAMATSAQRRSVTDADRAKRWSTYEAMASAWTECLQPFDSKSVSGRDLSALSYKYVAVLVTSFALARNMQRMEVDRRTQLEALNRYRVSTGTHAWRKLLHCLIEMSALFGPLGECLCNPELVFWKLDFTVCSSRMRRYLKRNYWVYDHLKAADNYEGRLHLKSSKESLFHTNDPQTYLKTSLPSTLIPIIEAISINGNIDEDDDDDFKQLSTNNVEHNMMERQRLSSNAEPMDSRNSVTSSDQNLVHSTLGFAPGFVSNEADERIVLELPSLMVRPLRVLRGNFQITTKRISFIVDEPSNDSSIAAAHKNEQDKSRSWLISSLHQVYSRRFMTLFKVLVEGAEKIVIQAHNLFHERLSYHLILRENMLETVYSLFFILPFHRYLLRRSALELYMDDRSSYFFDFGSNEGRKNAYHAITQARPPHLDSIYMETQRPEKLLKRTQLMERWARWEISNFEYLMELNILAGRSYNDITQYPVFPWILADYCSKTLDLKDSSSYRDLSKPVGALNPDRLKKFLERYSTFEDTTIPKFHYDSHYSSAATALYYLGRLDPFTTLSIELQGGKFNHADHTLLDIGNTWRSVLENVNDVKELVPEMFYLPEILTTEKLTNLGAAQLGAELDSIKLPPWADNSVDFIHKHRMALESEHVSGHLHEWIDLIFGYKQRGKEAILSNNVFLHITYEGMVDIDKISDPVQKHVIQDQIPFLGQTPTQLLKVPHLKRIPLADALHLQTIFYNPGKVKPYTVPSPEHCNVPAAAISASDDSIIVVDLNAPAANIAMHKWLPNTPDGQGTPFLFHHGRSAAGSTSGAFLRMFKGSGSASEEWQFPRALAFAASSIRSSAVVAVTCNKEIITGGHADNSVKLISADGAKTIETAAGHCAPVTCLAISPDSSYLVTGSRDTTVILWRIRSSPSHSNTASETPTSAQTTSRSPLTARNSTNITSKANSQSRRIQGPMYVLRGHHEEVVCCCVNSDLGLIASCSNTTGVLLHSLRRGRLIRRINVENVHAICLSPQGIVLVWNELENKLSTFTVNGISIQTQTLLPFSGTINCIQISNDGENALLGTCSSTDDNSREYGQSEVRSPGSQELGSSLSNEGSETQIPVPSILFLNLHTLKVFHSLALGRGQDVTALSLNKDNMSIIVSTADKQLIVFTDPDLCRKVGEQITEKKRGGTPSKK